MSLSSQFTKMTVSILCFAFLTLGGAQASDTSDKGPLLAKVADNPIYAKDVVAYAKPNPVMSGYMTHMEGLRRVLDDMINYRLLILEGARQNITKAADEREDHYVIRVKDQLMQKCERPDEAGSKKFFEDHPELFSTPPYARLSKAYLRKSDTVDGLNAADFLQGQAENVRSGRVDFDEIVAKVRQKVPTDVTLGDIGFMPLVETDHVIDLVRKASVGDVVGPFERDGNIFLFLVTEQRAAVPMKWEEVLAGAQDAAYNHCMQQNYATLRDEMTRHFPVVIYEETIRALKFN